MKDPDRSHFIQRFKFDVEIDSKEDAHRLQNGLSRMFNEKLTRLLDKIMSELDDPRYVTRIPKIEVDLGHVDQASMEREILYRFEQQFYRELRARMDEMRIFKTAAPSDRGERTMLVPAQIEILTYFLTQGRLPIGAENMAGKLEQLFWGLLESQPSNIARMLKLVAQNSASGLQRLATAFSDKLIERIYRLASVDNARSIVAFEEQVTENVAKITGRASNQMQVEIRSILIRYLFVEAPVVFNIAEMQKAVAETIVKAYGERTAPAFQAESKTQAKSGEEQSQSTREREAAIELITALIQGAPIREGNLAVIAAWEYLLARDVPALKRLIAQQASGPAPLTALVALLPPPALKDFLQRAVSGIGLRLIQLAATVISAHDLFSPTSGAQQRVSQAVYAALLHAATADPVKAPSPQAALAAIKQHLGEITSAPQQLLKAWDQFDFIEPARGRRPLDAPASDIIGEDGIPLTEEQATEARLKAQKEIEQLAEQERSKPRLSPAERKAAEEQLKREREEAALKREAWERAQLAGGDFDADSEEALEMLEDEAFFERGREILRHAATAGPQWVTLDDLEDTEAAENIFLAPHLATAEGRADVVMHFLATGSAPWWAKRFIPLQVETMVKNMVINEPQAIQAAFARLAKSLPPARYPLFVERMVTLLDEKTFMSLLPLLAGQLGGFAVSMGLVVKEAMDTLPASVATPSSPRAIRLFAFKYPLQFLMEYASSSPTPQQLIRYVLRELAALTGLAPRKTIEWVTQVVETLIAKGEPRFMPVKTMMPKVFEGIEVAPPAEHPLSADSIAFQRYLSDRKQATGSAEIEEAASAEQVAEMAALADAEKGKAEPGQEPVTGDQPEVQREDLQSRDAEGNVIDGGPSLDEHGNPIIEKGPALEEKEIRTELSETHSPEGKEKTIEGEDRPIEQQPKDPSIPPITPEEQEGAAGSPKSQAEIEKAKIRAQQSLEMKRKLDAQFSGPQEPQGPAAPMELGEEEAEALGIGEEWLLEVVRYYLLHGSLTPAATAMFTADSFREAIKGVLDTPSRAIIQMVRDLIGNPNVRMRIYALGDDYVLKAIALTNAAAADRMQPYVREMVEIFSGSASPVAKAYVFEHAIRHAVDLRTTFLPITYVKELFEFMAAQPNLRVEEAIHWANKKLESSASPLRNSIKEMLDVVERIEDLRQARKRAGLPTETKSVAPAIPQIPLDEEIYVSNGGIGIIYLFLITLFKAFGFLSDDKKEWTSQQAQIRAIHQIQYCCYKEIDSPEEKMVMAKLLVGWGINTPMLPLETPFGDEDIENCDVIMGMVCNQWGVMKNAGADYVRTTFIQRDGRLKYEGKDWSMKVEQNGIDVLKNKIPWSTNPIRMPWNDFVIEVEWP